jgi:alginate O-acetyltransferase complex protein AlgI
VLFNSWEFVLLFLPLALLLHRALGRLWGIRAGIGVLIVASLGFYVWWSPANLPVLLCSIVGNYLAGMVLQSDSMQRSQVARGWVLFVAIAVNLVALGHYKYTNFLIGSLNSLGASLQPQSILLPLGISFFTFTQIAYLVDSHRGKVIERSFPSYLVFVTYFPHLIAGPILHHSQMMPQLARVVPADIGVRDMYLGAAWFFIGLAKKVLLADSLAPFANAYFDAAADGVALTTAEAWTAALAYTFQLYFDFSGYSDMAIGLSLMFGVTLPLNFESPYKARNIIDFWRRWHITLSNFLRDYLYISMGGNRHGVPRRYANLVVTMLLGGLWHGASWTFVVWGGLHGLYLVMNHAWRWLTERFDLPRADRSTVLSGLSWLLTFLAVVVAWVLFRAESLESALAILAAMAGSTSANSASVAAEVASLIGPWSTSAEVTEMAGTRLIQGSHPEFYLVAAALIAAFAPNSRELTQRLEAIRLDRQHVIAGAVAMGVALVLLVNGARTQTQFLYFNF